MKQSKEYMKTYREANKDRINENARKRNSKNQTLSDYYRAYYAENREKILERERKRKRVRTTASLAAEKRYQEKKKLQKEHENIIQEIKSMQRGPILGSE